MSKHTTTTEQQTEQQTKPVVTRILGFNPNAVYDFQTGNIETGDRPTTANEMRKAIGASNDRTIKRWLEGNDLYMSSAIRMCDELHLDPLRFFTVDGNALRSSLEDLYRLEQSGTDCATLLRERGIEPNDHTLHNCQSDKMWATELEARRMFIDSIHQKGQEYESRQAARDIANMSNGDIIYQVAKIQRESFEHETRALDSLRREYQQTIDNANIRIGALIKDSERLAALARQQAERIAELEAQLDRKPRRIDTDSDAPGAIAADNEQ